MILDPDGYEPEAHPVTIKRWFPADVTLPDGRMLTNALAIATHARLYVWTRRAGAPREVALTYLAEHTEAASSLRAQAALPSAATRIEIGGDGSAVIRRGSGCGCSDPLKTFVPWAPQRSGT